MSTPLITPSIFPLIDLSAYPSKIFYYSRRLPFMENIVKRLYENGSVVKIIKRKQLILSFLTMRGRRQWGRGDAKRRVLAKNDRKWSVMNRLTDVEKNWKFWWLQVKFRDREWILDKICQKRPNFRIPYLSINAFPAETSKCSTRRINSSFEIKNSGW